MTIEPLRVTIWNEHVHERRDPAVGALYPGGIHLALRQGIAPHLPADSVIRTATLADDEQGLGAATLDDTDVLVWWGHAAHEEVDDELVDRVHRRVLAGMGLVALHSAHYAKIFRRLMGTSCTLGWRDDGDEELIWNVAPGHPITEGVEFPIHLASHETYAEFFDVPPPDELLMISAFSGGEVFRSGMTYTRGLGRIFYFSPGDQLHPVYAEEQVLRVIANGVRWARGAAGERAQPSFRALNPGGPFGAADLTSRHPGARSCRSG